MTNDTSNICFDDFRKTNVYDIAIASGRGMRDKQQDAGYIAASDRDIMAIVCDGMGGSECGDMASKTAVAAFLEYYSYYSIRDLEFNGEWLKTAAEEIDDIVYQMKAPNGKRLRAGTTMVAVLIQDNQLYWLSVGDSRIYIIRKNEIVQVTTDHNYYLELDRKLKEGMITKEEYNKEKHKGEALISFLGMGGLTMLDINPEAFLLQREDVILICSDGLYRALDEWEMLYDIRNSVSMEAAGNLLEREIAAKKIPDQDNFTFFLIKNSIGSTVEK